MNSYRAVGKDKQVVDDPLMGRLKPSDRKDPKTIGRRLSGRTEILNTRDPAVK